MCVVLAICLLAAWPFLVQPGLPQETDAELHILRTAELHHLLSSGAVYPRWAPDFYFGYGYPLFNYYAPLSYYLGAALMAVPTVGAVLAVKLVFVLGVAAAGSGMYAFVRRHWGEHAGLIAASAYLFTPYIQYIDPHARGDLPEALSLGLFPWVLWAFSRLSDRRLRWRVPFAAGLLAALICTHNLMALIFGVMVASWMGWRFLFDRQGPERPLGQRIATYAPELAALTLSVLLSAFFWLPVALERHAVQLGNLVSHGGHFDFRNHFLTLREMLRTTELLDLGATEPHYVRNVGLAQWVFGLLGGATLLLRRPPFRRHGLFFLIASAVLCLLMLPVSTFVWQRVPLMPFIQFPWRLLGPLAACVAVLSGIATASLGAAMAERRKASLTTAIVAAFVLLGLPLTFPPEWPADFGPTQPADIIRHELEGRWLGTTSGGEFVPADVMMVAGPNGKVLQSYVTGEQVDRVNRATLPDAAQVTQINDHPLRWSYEIKTSSPFVFRLFHFYFPGWVARLDGETVPITPAKPDGFMTVEIPARAHKLQVSFHDTPQRTFGWAVSGLGLLLCLAAGYMPGTPTDHPGQALRLPLRTAYPLLTAILVLLIVRGALAPTLGWFRLESQGLKVARAEHTVHYVFDGQIALIGYNWQPADPGASGELILYWRALRPVGENLQVFVHLRDQQGMVAAQSDKLNPGDYPTERWPLDKYIRDEHILRIPPDLPPGEYQIAVGLWRMSVGTRIPIVNDAGQPTGDSAFLESIDY